MPYMCCVPKCNSNYRSSKERNIKVFKFPRDEEKKNKWLKMIPRQNFIPSKTSVVCIKHFEDHFICKVDRLQRPDGSWIEEPRIHFKLTEDAYPTIFEGFAASLSKKLPRKQEVPEECIQEIDNKDERIQRNDGSQIEEPRIHFKLIEDAYPTIYEGLPAILSKKLPQKCKVSDECTQEIENKDDRIQKTDGSWIEEPRTHFKLEEDAYPIVFESFPASLSKKLPQKQKVPGECIQEIDNRNARIQRNDGSWIEEPRIHFKLKEDVYPTIYEGLPAILSKRLPQKWKVSDECTQEMDNRDDRIQKTDGSWIEEPRIHFKLKENDYEGLPASLSKRLPQKRKAPDEFIQEIDNRDEDIFCKWLRYGLK